mmetsp:Transcript_22155/g.37856  ORF Transcript_22155/g.37856 Transcript_22155/m.37856 type:complete len:87 (+) Transcript_22155:1203-1463(+)
MHPAFSRTGRYRVTTYDTYYKTQHAGFYESQMQVTQIHCLNAFVSLELFFNTCLLAICCTDTPRAFAIAPMDLAYIHPVFCHLIAC